MDLDALVVFGGPDGVAAALRHGKRGIDEALAAINNAFVAQRIRQLREDHAHLA